MRRTITILLVVGSVVFPFSGLIRAEVTGFGVKAGLSYANIHGRDVYEQRSRIGFGAGAFLTFGLGSSFAVQPEVLFVMKGSKYSNGSGADAYRETLGLDYIEVPVLIKFFLPVAGPFRLHLFAGPSLAFKLRARVEATFGGETEVETLDNVKNTDLGLAAGVGLEHPLGRGRLTLDLRYTAGMGSLSKGTGDDIKNGALGLFAGYSF
jgi:hypothetical protein